jgi:hypothetical protein
MVRQGKKGKETGQSKTCQYREDARNAEDSKANSPVNTSKESVAARERRSRLARGEIVLKGGKAARYQWQEEDANRWQETDGEREE